MELDTSALFIGSNGDEYNIPMGNVVVCGVPGAFTPGCTKRHLPEFAKNISFFNKVVFISINDPVVMDVWNKLHGHGEIDSVGDPLGLFTKSIGMEKDFGPTMGIRSKRYAALFKDGKFVKFFEQPWAEDVLDELQTV